MKKSNTKEFSTLQRAPEKGKDLNEVEINSFWGTNTVSRNDSSNRFA